MIYCTTKVDAPHFTIQNVNKYTMDSPRNNIIIILIDMSPQHFNCVNDLILFHLCHDFGWSLSFLLCREFSICLFSLSIRKKRETTIELGLDISASNKLFRFIYFHCNVNYFFLHKILNKQKNVQSNHWNVKTSGNSCILFGLNAITLPWQFFSSSSSFIFFNEKFKPILIAIHFFHYK